MGFFGDIVEKAIKTSDSKKNMEYWSERCAQIEMEKEKEYQEFIGEFTEKADTEMQCTVIGSMLHEIGEKDYGDRDYSVLEQLPDYYKKSMGMEYFSLLLRDKVYFECVYAFISENRSLLEIMRMLKPLAYFETLKEEISHSLKHYRYLSQDGQDIRSVLTDEQDLEAAFERLKEKREISQEQQEKEEKVLQDIFSSGEVIQELFDKKEYQKIFDILSRAEYDEWIFDFLKKFLLHIAVRENDSSTVTMSYEAVREIVDNLFQTTRIEKVVQNGEISYKVIRIPVSDIIIADAIRYNKSGMIDNINDDLERFLKYFPVRKQEADISQFEVLRKVFFMLKAYKQEKMVLESMITHNIPRTDFQEKRLTFLRNSSVQGWGIDSLSRKSPRIIKNEESQEGMVYDYRSMSWNEPDIMAYLNSLSEEDKTLKTPMVVDEWNDNLNTNNIEWDQDDFAIALTRCLKENFGDKYLQKSVRSGVLMDGDIDFEESLLILEDQRKQPRYPWLHFIMSVEKLTLNQVLFSIYTLYDPNDDYKDDGDIFNRNAQIANRIIGLKRRQNPKINNYINVMKNVIVEELEKYLNTTSNESTIY